MQKIFYLFLVTYCSINFKEQILNFASWIRIRILPEISQYADPDPDHNYLLKL